MARYRDNQIVTYVRVMMLVVCGLLLVGCSNIPREWLLFPPPEDGAKSTTDSGITVPSENERDDIVRVAKIVPTNPWIKFDPLGNVIDGFRCAIYLSALVESDSGGRGEKGVFGLGTIRVQMFAVDFDKESKKETLRPLHVWELDRDEAFKYRAKNPTMLGWGYGLRLRWPDNIDVAGRKVAFHISYERKDGMRIAASRPTIKRVPLSGV